MARRPNVITRGTGYVGALLFGKTKPALLFKGAGAPTDGAAGTGAGEAEKGSIYVDTDNGRAYINQGTKASPTWNDVAATAVADIDETLIKYATVTLTNAQILALRATPIEMVAAPGAGKKIHYLGSTLNGSFAAGAYTETADNLAFKMVDGSGPKVSDDIEMTGFIDQAAKIHTTARAKADAILTDVQAVNTALVLHNLGDGEFGAGNAANSMRVTVAYRIVPTL